MATGGASPSQPEQDEKSPLLPDAKHVKGIYTKPLHSVGHSGIFGFLDAMITVPKLAFMWHWVSILFSIASAILCWSVGWEQYSTVDPMIFKSIFVVFGFALGFRNVRSNQRYGDALNNVKIMFGAAWSIIALFRQDEAESRRKVNIAMVKLLKSITRHLHAILYRTDSWFALVGLHPKDPEGDHDVLEQGIVEVEQGIVEEIEEEIRPMLSKQTTSTLDPERCVEVQLGPRPLMVSTFVMIGNEICRMETMPLQERKRAFWFARMQFFEAFDACELLTMPSVTMVYQMLINFSLFLFGLAVPWGIAVSGSKHKLHMANDIQDLAHGKIPKDDALQSLLFIVFNTSFCMIILFGLNALAHENEQPFKAGPEAIQVDRILARFQEAVAGYEARMTAVGDVLEVQKDKALSDNVESVAAFTDVAQHMLACTGRPLA